MPTKVTRPALVSMLTPTLGRPDKHEALYAGYAADQWPNKELVVLDESREPSPFFRKLSDPTVRYFHEPGKPRIGGVTRIGAARNRLVQLARGSVCLHRDDDDWYDPEKYVSIMLERLGDADVAKLSTWRLLHRDLVYLWRTHELGGEHFAIRGDSVERINVDDLSPEEAQAYRDAFACGFGWAMVYKRDVALKHPFPETGTEDIPWIRRLRDAGARIVFVDDCAHLALHIVEHNVVHAEGGSPHWPQKLLGRLRDIGNPRMMGAGRPMEQLPTGKPVQIVPGETYRILALIKKSHSLASVTTRAAGWGIDVKSAQDNVSGPSVEVPAGYRLVEFVGTGSKPVTLPWKAPKMLRVLGENSRVVEAWIGAGAPDDPDVAIVSIGAGRATLGPRGRDVEEEVILGHRPPGADDRLGAAGFEQDSQKTLEELRAFAHTLSARDQAMLALGMQASHIEEAIAGGDFPRAQSHLDALRGQLQVLESQSGKLSPDEMRNPPHRCSAASSAEIAKQIDGGGWIFARSAPPSARIVAPVAQQVHIRTAGGVAKTIAARFSADRTMLVLRCPFTHEQFVFRRAPAVSGYARAIVGAGSTSGEISAQFGVARQADGSYTYDGETMAPAGSGTVVDDLVAGKVGEAISAGTLLAFEAGLSLTIPVFGLAFAAILAWLQSNSGNPPPFCQGCGNSCPDLWELGNGGYGTQALMGSRPSSGDFEQYAYDALVTYFKSLSACPDPQNDPNGLVAYSNGVAGVGAVFPAIVKRWNDTNPASKSRFITRRVNCGAGPCAGNLLTGGGVCGGQDFLGFAMNQMAVLPNYAADLVFGKCEDPSAATAWPIPIGAMFNIVVNDPHGLGSVMGGSHGGGRVNLPVGGSEPTHPVVKTAIGVAVVGAAAAGGVGLWAYLTGQAYSEAWSRILKIALDQTTESARLLTSVRIPGVGERRRRRRH